MGGAVGVRGFIFACELLRANLESVSAQVLAAGAEVVIKRGGETCNICGDVRKDLWRRLVIVTDQGLVVTGLQYGKSSTQNLPSVITFNGRMGGQGHGAQSNDIRIAITTWLPFRGQKDEILENPFSQIG